MKYFIYFSFLFICISINAQTDVPTNLKNDTIFSPKLTGESFIENNQYKGEQYFNKDWEKADIMLSTGEMVYNKRLKYNGLHDEIIWLNTLNYGKYQLDKSYISDLWFKFTPDSIIHFKRIDIVDTTGVHRSDFFAQVGVEGNVSLYIQRKISIMGEENMNNQNSLLFYKVLEETPVYYIKKSTSHIIKISRISRRAFLKVFPEQKKEIVKIMRDNHLNLETENDLINVINLLNKKVFY